MTKLLVTLLLAIGALIAQDTPVPQVTASVQNLCSTCYLRQVLPGIPSQPFVTVWVWDPTTSGDAYVISLDYIDQSGQKQTTTKTITSTGTASYGWFPIDMASGTVTIQVIKFIGPAITQVWGN